MPAAPFRHSSLARLFARSASTFLAVWLVGGASALVLSTTIGCQSDEKPPTPVNQPDEHDEHEHDDHEHGDHEHGDHEHGDHEHGDRVNADEAGLDTDDLVYLDRPAAPDSLEEAVAQLTATRDDIADGFASDDVDSIHDQLHSVGDLLEAIETFVEDSDMSTERQEEASEAVETLFTEFGDVDAKLHGGDGEDYADVAESINEAIATLQELSVAE